MKGSGGKYRYGKMIRQSNKTLKWAFIEAANVIFRQCHHLRWGEKYVTRLYESVRQRKAHSVAVGAVAHHLSEANYWVSKKGEAYREPGKRREALPRQGQARA
jgi:hypothetical protein